MLYRRSLRLRGIAVLPLLLLFATGAFRLGARLLAPVADAPERGRARADRHHLTNPNQRLLVRAEPVHDRAPFGLSLPFGLSYVGHVAPSQCTPRHVTHT